jgi:hypothetical protein
VAHPTNYFGWMLQGEALFQALEPSHPLLHSLPITGAACFETFPHAITWHLRGGNATAARKHPQRRALVERFGLDSTPFTRIDLIDAALCALAAHQAASGGAAATLWIEVDFADITARKAALIRMAAGAKRSAPALSP